MEWFKCFLIVCSLTSSTIATAQAENEIQVYASPTIGEKRTIAELHNNYTFNGSKNLADRKSARWVNHTLEITRGLAKNVEIGFYTFVALSPNGKYQYLGNQIRPRVTAPERWKLPFGASLSAEFGRFRDNVFIPFYWQGEIRPIIDKTFGSVYASFNPNIDFVVSGPNKEWGFSPQFKTFYNVKQKVGLGVEYYSGLGSFNNFRPVAQQEHLLGPMFDLLAYPDWELQTGFLFGLTPNSNQSIFKLLIGRRF
ncbi:hypothetical protein [Segetibacter sp.]|jgi:hypothetical protein|uniref:hypothetical protein n=1 Tax=Segetibacter sp. TaxID=2231182 RepID=UPI0026376F9D|nr:hypothetical protein [Segetibacter sp.]MCW3079748.1 hypothetical protein [Segetibacter sp.]